LEKASIPYEHMMYIWYIW